MLGKKIGVLISIFMMFLVVSMPIVFAKSIGSYTVSGQDGLENVINADNDYVFVEVEVNLEENDTIDEDELYFEYSKTETFDSCIDNYCFYQSSQSDRTPQEMEWTISIIEESSILDTVEGTLTIDGEEPEIDDYDLDVEDEEITIEYEIIDTACESCLTCSGIDTVYIYQDDTVVLEENGFGACELEDEIETSVEELNLEDGDHEICVEAVDKLGFVSDQECAPISVDRTGPYFETGSFRIIDGNTEEELYYVGQDQIPVTLYVNITDDNLNENAVYADISSINSGYSSGSSIYNNVSATCDKISAGYFECYWSGWLAYGIDGTNSIKFTGYDVNGNSGTYTGSFTVVQDEEPPTVVSVYKQSSGEEFTLKNGENVVKALIDPTGSAFENGEVYLEYSYADEDGIADSCEESGSYWECSWNFTSSDTVDTDTHLYITDDTTDDAGNELESNYGIVVHYDGKAPIIDGVGMYVNADYNCPTAADLATVKVNVTDDSEDLYIELEAEKILLGDQLVEGDCDDVDEGEYECEIELEDFVQYDEDEDVIIRVYDAAGNYVEQDFEIQVCELEEIDVPNFIEIYDIGYGDITPNDVDKKSLSFANIPVFVDLSIHKRNDVTIVSKQVECGNVARSYFFDTNGDDEAAILVTDLLQNPEIPADQDETEVECQISFAVQYKDTIYAQPEVENVTFDVDLYGIPLGSVEQGIYDRIQMQQAGIDKAEDKINDWVAVNMVFGIICNIVENLAGLNSIFGAVKGIVFGIALVLDKAKSVPALTSAAEASKAAYNFICKGFGKFNAVMYKGIWPPGFGFSAGGTSTYGAMLMPETAATGMFTGGLPNLPFLKIACMLQSGKLCEGIGWVGRHETKVDDETGEANTVTVDGETIDVRFDPFRSIHTAKYCLYGTAYIYNLRKERQINCMYRNCLQQSAEAGLPIETCDMVAKERDCVYVDGGTYWLRIGEEAGPQHAFFYRMFMSNLDWLLESIAYDLLQCPAKYNQAFDKSGSGDAGSITVDWSNAEQACALNDGYEDQNILFVACNVLAAVLVTQETGLFDDHAKQWEFAGKLTGEDYCLTTESGTG